MFGISFTEILVIAVVTLVVVGPQRLPGMLRNVGTWVGKIRSLTTQVRQQTGIDDILREEGLSGGLTELRSMLRGEAPLRPKVTPGRGGYDRDDPYWQHIELDPSREQPAEGPDSYGALPDDLVLPEDRSHDAGPPAPSPNPDAA